MSLNMYLMNYAGTQYRAQAELQDPRGQQCHPAPPVAIYVIIYIYIYIYVYITQLMYSINHDQLFN